MLKNFLIALAVGLLVSCSAENDEIFNNLSESIIETQPVNEQDTDSNDEIEIFNGDNELIERMNAFRIQQFGKSRALLGPSDVDPLLAENLSALQGLPFNLIVKGVAAGADPTHNCLLSNKSNREATLNTQLKGAT